MPLPENILEAAARLVALHGPDGFTMDDLARESGMSRATLYRQAGSREALLAVITGQGVDVGRRGDVRERILEACRVVFTRAGFEAATLEDIAQEAGVGPVTIYRHFGDKQGLIAAFAGQIGPRRAMEEVAFHSTGDLRTDLERTAAAAIRYAIEDLDLLKLAVLERMRGGPWAELLKDSPVRAQALLIRLLKSYAASGALGPNEPQRMAQAFIGMLFAFLAGPLLTGQPPPDPEETARFITHVFLDGVASKARKAP